MSIGVNIENLAMERGGRSIYVNRQERVCVNCQCYEQYFRKNRGNVYTWVPVNEGYCLLHECHRGPLRQTCKDFEALYEREAEQ